MLHEGPKFRKEFTGKEFDDDGYVEEVDSVHYGTEGMGYLYFGARYYDPEIGLWTSTDPAEQYYSNYTYCGDNPLMTIDKDGTVGFGLQVGASATNLTTTSETNLFHRNTHQWEIRFIYDHSKGFGLKQLFNKHNWSGNITYTRNKPEGDIYFSIGEHFDISLSFLITNATHQSQLLGSSKAGGLTASWLFKSLSFDLTVMETPIYDYSFICELAIPLPFPYTSVGFGAEFHFLQNYETESILEWGRPINDE